MEAASSILRDFCCPLLIVSEFLSWMSDCVDQQEGLLQVLALIPSLMGCHLQLFPETNPLLPTLFWAGCFITAIEVKLESWVRLIIFLTLL